MRTFKASFKFLVSASDMAEIYADVKQIHDEAERLLLKIRGVAKKNGLHLSADEEIKHREDE